MISRQIVIDHDDTVVVASVEDVEPLLDYTKAMHNEGHHGSNDMKFAGSIPNVLIEDYCTKAGITYEEWCQNKDHVKRLLNDPAIGHFRVWKGRI